MVLDYASWSPETAKKRSVSRWTCKNKRPTNSHCRCPDVPAIVPKGDIVRGTIIIVSVVLSYFISCSVTVSFRVPSKSFGSCKCPLRLGSELLPQRSCTMWRSNTKDTGPDGFVRYIWETNCLLWRDKTRATENTYIWVSVYERLKAKTVVSIRLGEAGNLCVYYKSTTTHGWRRPHNFRKFEKFWGSGS